MSNVLMNAGVQIAQNTTDDIALVWLKNQRQTTAAVAALHADERGANTARIQDMLSGDALAARFGDPRTNTRTPDLIVQPEPGTIYTTSKAKVAEHGGFAADDTHVALLVVGPTQGEARRIDARVRTTQIAPTILKFLGARSASTAVGAGTHAERAGYGPSAAGGAADLLGVGSPTDRSVEARTPRRLRPRTRRENPHVAARKEITRPAAREPNKFPTLAPGNR